MEHTFRPCGPSASPVRSIMGARDHHSLLPLVADALAAIAVVEQARHRCGGATVVDHVAPDHHPQQPTACMGGWGRRILVVTPAGRVLPCHAAETLSGLGFWSVREHLLADTWEGAPAFNEIRGASWMTEPCRFCVRRELDFGECRWQTFDDRRRCTRHGPRLRVAALLGNAGQIRDWRVCQVPVQGGDNSRNHCMPNRSKHSASFSRRANVGAVRPHFPAGAEHGRYQRVIFPRRAYDDTSPMSSGRPCTFRTSWTAPAAWLWWRRGQPVPGSNERRPG